MLHTCLVPTPMLENKYSILTVTAFNYRGALLQGNTRWNTPWGCIQDLRAFVVAWQAGGVEAQKLLRLGLASPLSDGRSKIQRFQDSLSTTF